MQFDFESFVDRSGQDSIAADPSFFYGPESGRHLKEGFDLIPMWVADMAFETAPSVVNAMSKRLEHKTFGYFSPKKEYFDAIKTWQREEHGVTDLEDAQIGYENSVLGGLVSALRVMADPGEGVLLHAPTYIGFTGALENNGYRIVLSDLLPDDQGIFRMNFSDMEEKIQKEQIRVAILCSPHNPTGRVWERTELEQAMELFRKYNVSVISDEIWSDLVLFGNKHIPTQQISEDAKNRTVALYAPTKTFNLAGLVGSYHIVYSEEMGKKLEKQASLSHYNQMNVLSMHALLGAYCKEGKEWLVSLRQVLEQNMEYACQKIGEDFPGVSVTRPQGTYMLFLDCTEYCKTHQKTLDELLNAGMEYGVLWQDGRPFHGTCHIRMNLALPHRKLKEALDRLDRFVFRPR